MDLTIEKFSLSGITVTIFFDNRRVKDDLTYPVKYRVTYKRVRAYYPSGIDLSEDEWKIISKTKKRELIETRELIQAGFDKVKEHVKDLALTDEFTLEGLNNRLKGSNSDSILTAFEDRIKDLQAKGKIGTAVWYSCAKNSIEKYTTKDIKFTDVTPTWLEKYEAHLLKEGKEYTTISINMRALRAIINNAKARGIVKAGQYPFAANNNGKYQIPEGSGRKIALNTTQLIEVFKYPILPEWEKYRDLWIFSFYCNGVNIGDLLRFKYENIQGNYLEWYRVKTKDRDKLKAKIRAAITEEMQAIIYRYGNRDKRGYIFPYLTIGLTPTQERMIIQNVTHTINKKMKKIGQALGYGDITTYWARHTWASISRREGVSTFSISKGMGHKNLSTTEIYLDSLSDEEINENAAKLPRR